MKFTINIECTPEEAREFMGLPDPEKMQEHMMAAMQDKMKDMPENIQEGMKYWQDIQKMMWAQMTTSMGAPNDQNNKDKA